MHRVIERVIRRRGARAQDLLHARIGRDLPLHVDRAAAEATVIGERPRRQSRPDHKAIG
jgi:hypothetical protein